MVCNGGGGTGGGGDGDGDRARALVDLGFAEVGLPFPLAPVLIFGATSGAGGSSGPILALSSASGTMGEACWESGGGCGTEVTRAGGDFWGCSCISTSESMFCIDESQDKH
jgi:hypothetical protein